MVLDKRKDIWQYQILITEEKGGVGMQWNTYTFLGTVLVVSLIIISIIKPGGAIEEKITSNGKFDTRKAYNTLGISMTICLLNGGLIRYAGDEHPFLLILAIVIIVLDISLTIRYVNSGKINKK